MHTIEANWEDEENNRQVSFAVQFIRKENLVEIQSITPKQVTFLCPQSQAPLRTIGVWTDKGRQMLSQQFQASGRFADVEASLAV